jgi:hypothetical protein
MQVLAIGIDLYLFFFIDSSFSFDDFQKQDYEVR